LDSRKGKGKDEIAFKIKSAKKLKTEVSSSASISGVDYICEILVGQRRHQFGRAAVSNLSRKQTKEVLIRKRGLGKGNIMITVSPLLTGDGEIIGE